MEIEFKFEVPAQRFKAVEKELRALAAKAARKHMQAHYFDTEGGTLAAHGVALRLRKEGRRWVQTAKALGDGPLHRLEHNVDLTHTGAGHPEVDAQRHAGSAVGDLLDKLLEHGEVPLVETFGTDIWRLACIHQSGDTTVEFALDVGKVMTPPRDGDDGRTSPVCELEIELIDGDVATLVALAHEWSQRHGLWFSTVSKAERGQRLCDGQASAKAVKASPTKFAHEHGHDVSGAIIQRTVLAACLAHVLPNASEVAAGNEDIEVVHQLRVGIRRTRTALRELDALAPASLDPAWEAPLVEAFRVLGASRDRELLLGAMQPRLEAAGAPSVDLGPGEDAHSPPIGDAVRSPAFQAALVSMTGFAASTPDEAPNEEQGTSPHRQLQKQLNKLHKQLTQDGKHFESLDSDAQHRVRKRIKRLRYLADFVAPLFGKADAERYIASLVPAQDALGEFNDEVVAMAAYRDAAERDPRAWFAVGWLSALKPAKARACRKCLGQLAKARKFWKKDG
ncbi:CYTH and CHAD domain-containing protein [Variovorax sp. J22R133]|uniref:CYTH and CHAD domain-containing protein n=1 Tax=Variovorax brevis TaxID=3053503 RepID=UPI0025760491|nr:CYTH and CHAD domain-containing protein [Variovorax sp. J22R133]MDM0112255.1 CYTH and CHAD domain-containing protein [Variovorax sp. J22R133]